MEAVVVVPSIREDRIKEFLKRWQDQFAEHTIIVVEDNPHWSFDLPDNVRHYCHADIEDDLGENAWIIPRKTDCVRSYGIWKAWLLEPDMIVTLDDDCYPVGNSHLLDEHWANLERHMNSYAWTSTIVGARPRGHPIDNVLRRWPCAISHGLWEGSLDLDAITELTMIGTENVTRDQQAIPVGQYFSMCGMNVAWRPRFTPLMYFGLMGQDYPYDRFGDIWCGVIAKKIVDHLGWGVWSGQPYVRHERASDKWTNFAKEAPAMETNEHFWPIIDDVILDSELIEACYLKIAKKLEDDGSAYFSKLGRAMQIWLELFA